MTSPINPCIAFLFFGHKILEEIFETTGKTLISKDYELNEYSYIAFLMAYLYLFYIVGKTLYSFVSSSLKHENKEHIIKEDIAQVKDELADITEITQELTNDLNSGFNSTLLSISQLEKEIKKKIQSKKYLEEIKESIRKDIDRVYESHDNLIEINQELGNTTGEVNQRFIRRIKRSICSVINELDKVGNEEVKGWVGFKNYDEDEDENEDENEIEIEDI